MTQKQSKSMLDRIYEIGPKATGTQIKDFYSLWADSYDDEVQAINHYAMPARAANAIAHIVEDRSISIMDVGCGTGLSGQAVHDLGFSNLHGCDFSPPMLEKARARGIYQSLQQVDLMDIPVPIDAGAYDLTMAVGVFANSHLGPAAGGEILRITKSGGIICLTMNDVYADTGKMQGMVTRFEATDQIKVHSIEHGEHLPGHNVKGWVYMLEKL